MGHVCDVEIDVCTGQVMCLVVCRGRLFARYGCESDLRIPWCDVDVVGDDIILVCYTPPPQPCKQHDCSRPRFGFFR